MTNKEALKNYLLKNGKTHSWAELAKKFNTTSEAARHTWRRLKANQEITLKNIIPTFPEDVETQNYIAQLEDYIISTVDNKAGTAQFSKSSTRPIESLQDLIEVTKIDTTIWNIDKYIQNFYDGKYQVKAFCSKITPQQNFTEEFTKFLEVYKPSSKPIKRLEGPKLGNSSCLIINKQDPHLNKKDVEGNNDINKRFEDIYSAIDVTIQKAQMSSNLNKIVYIVGSDEFNSEWTGMTTKGTPQGNILSYHESFERICDFEISVISNMLSYADVEVIYVPGNHDEYVGWHLINFLKSYFRNEEVEFDTTTDYTKYRRFGTSALMFNHGDAIKPEKLAQMFPIEFKKDWSKCDNFYIFVGDKHHNHIKDLNGIQFFQLPAMSNAKGNWDKKNGYTCNKAKLVSFVIDEKNGITDIYYQPI